LRAWSREANSEAFTFVEDNILGVLGYVRKTRDSALFAFTTLAADCKSHVLQVLDVMVYPERVILLFAKLVLFLNACPTKLFKVYDYGLNEVGF
jgi:hypothetical protein